LLLTQQTTPSESGVVWQSGAARFQSTNPSASEDLESSARALNFISFSASDRDKRFPSFAMGMHKMRAQGAIRSAYSSPTNLSAHRQMVHLSRCSSRTYCSLGQGATEYLVLLAVVLIVALVSVALLGFFPGMASDAQVTQSKMYWQSASPIAITESDATTNSASYGLPYLRIRNAGTYPIQITKMLGNGQSVSQFQAGVALNISDYYYLAPGEEKYFGWNLAWALPANRLVYFFTSGTSSDFSLRTASSICNFNSTQSGTLQMNSFGFEYIEYIEGQQITKQQVGKPLIIKCRSYP